MPAEDILVAITDIKKLSSEGLKIDLVAKGSDLPQAISYRAAKGYNPILVIKSGDTDIRSISGFKKSSPDGDQYVDNAKNQFVLLSIIAKKE